MQNLDNRLILSATDLINHLECPHLTHLDMEVALGRIELEPTRTDAVRWLQNIHPDQLLWRKFSV